MIVWFYKILMSNPWQNTRVFIWKKKKGDWVKFFIFGVPRNVKKWFDGKSNNLVIPLVYGRKFYNDTTCPDAWSLDYLARNMNT